MSDLARIDAGPMVQLAPQTISVLTERPLLAVPPEVRPAVFSTWAVYRHLAGLETPAPIAFAVSVWVNRHGVRPSDVADALAAVTHPRHMRQARFASDLLAALADLLAAPESPAEWAARVSRGVVVPPTLKGGAE